MADQVVYKSEAPPTYSAQPVETVYNQQSHEPKTYSGTTLVRPLEGLGKEPDKVDCTQCEAVRETVVERVPSHRAEVLSTFLKYWVVLSCCCCFYTCARDLPEKHSIYYDYKHKCPVCNETFITIRHNHQQGHAEKVQSRYGSRN